MKIPSPHLKKYLPEAGTDISVHLKKTSLKRLSKQDRDDWEVHSQYSNDQWVNRGGRSPAPSSVESDDEAFSVTYSEASTPRKRLHEEEPPMKKMKFTVSPKDDVAAHSPAHSVRNVESDPLEVPNLTLHPLPPIDNPANELNQCETDGNANVNIMSGGKVNVLDWGVFYSALVDAYLNNRLYRPLTSAVVSTFACRPALDLDFTAGDVLEEEAEDVLKMLTHIIHQVIRTTWPGLDPSKYWLLVTSQCRNEDRIFVKLSAHIHAPYIVTNQDYMRALRLRLIESLRAAFTLDGLRELGGSRRDWSRVAEAASGWDWEKIVDKSVLNLGHGLRGMFCKKSGEERYKKPLWLYNSIDVRKKWADLTQNNGPVGLYNLAILAHARVEDQNPALTHCILEPVPQGSGRRKRASTTTTTTATTTTQGDKIPVDRSDPIHTLVAQKIIEHHPSLEDYNMRVFQLDDEKYQVAPLPTTYCPIKAQRDEAAPNHSNQKTSALITRDGIFVTCLSDHCEGSHRLVRFNEQEITSLFGGESDDDDHDVDDIDWSFVEEYNQKYGVVIVGERVRVMEMDYLNVDLASRDIRMFSPDEFYKWKANELIEVEGKMKQKARLWFSNLRRRQYCGIIFAPGQASVVNGHYNLWQGWGVEAREGSCDLILRHILEVICNGSVENYNYVLGWLAHMVQHPEDIPGTALVLRGDEGTGKGMFVEQLIGPIVGPHFKHLTGSYELTSQFNGFLKDTLLIFADEAHWAGDKSGDGRLKGLITEQYLMVEFKGIDRVHFRNHTHLVMSSNNSWVVPAGPTARRYVVLDVSAKYRGNYTYFDSLVNEINSGGKEAFLYYLQHHAMAGFNPRVLPKDCDAALWDNKLESLPPVGKWWYDRLVDGRLGTYSDDPTWPTNPVQKELVHRAFLEASSRARIIPTSMAGFVKEWKKYAPNINTGAREKSGDRPRCFGVPSLKECRDAFSKVVNTPYGILFDD